jgi:hypothetical protein
MDVIARSTLEYAQAQSSRCDHGPRQRHSRQAFWAARTVKFPEIGHGFRGIGRSPTLSVSDNGHRPFGGGSRLPVAVSASLFNIAHFQKQAQRNDPRQEEAKAVIFSVACLPRRFSSVCSIADGPQIKKAVQAQHREGAV